MLSTYAETKNIEKIYHNPEEFINQLIKLEQEGYLFRGVENREFDAQPKAFRPNEIKKNWEKYPISYDNVFNEWFYHPDIIRLVQSNYAISESEIKKHPAILRLFRFKSYLLVCNYLFTKYKEENPSHVFENDIHQMQDRGSGFWADRKTFNYQIGFSFPLILTREALDKSWRHEGQIDEIFTNLDMSFPQHYGISTAALDFTKKFLVAIYFSIVSHLEVKLNTASGLYVATKPVNYDNFLSVYAIKMLNNSDDSSIRIGEIDESIPNPRAQNQHGVLCTFLKPCSYYMNHGCFPMIENYLGEHNSFKFRKLSLFRSVSNLDILAKVLNTHEINRRSIYPDDNK